MVRRTVAILSFHSLLGEGMARLLEADERLQVVRIDASQADARDRLRRLQPDVIIVTEDDYQRLDMLGLLGETIEALVISLHPSDSAMDIYRHWRVAGACSSDLRSVILTHKRGAGLSGPVRLSWRPLADRSSGEAATNTPSPEENRP